MFLGSKSRPTHVRTFLSSNPPLLVHHGIQNFIGVPYSPPRYGGFRKKKFEQNALLFVGILNGYICFGYAGAARADEHHRRRDISSSELAIYATSSLVSCKTYH